MSITWSSLSLVGQITLILLLLLSIISWGIMIDRWFKFRRAKHESLTLLRQLNRASRIEDCISFSRNLIVSPAARSISLTASRAIQENDPFTIERYSKLVGEQELSKLETGLPFLASIASVTPFIGLFGTVWGIMETFMGIGTYGTPNVAVVAPGIAEALVNTAAGLAVAIPAVFGYNHFVSKLRQETRNAEQALEFLLDLHRKTR
ncbi:MAG: MotA/TolQ/ExbB proton channel family protein [bacterium]|nr:MotA/TolQ/ExbB proton channel family protein [bacterium]